jgi:DNA-nicking Smr family endonuclease
MEKKKKTSNQPPAEFQHNPFKSLKQVKPSLSTASSPARPEKRKSTPAEDEELFQRAMSGAKKLHDEDEPEHAETRAEKKSAPVPAEDSDLFLQAMQQIGTSLRINTAGYEPAEPEQCRTSSRRARQLRRGTLRINAELDLHGFTRDEAMARLQRFIAESFQRGLEAVLVITGKGINSPEGPVLQVAAREWLEGKGRQLGMVAEFSSAPRDKGGSGAFVVFLKRR